MFARFKHFGLSSLEHCSCLSLCFGANLYVFHIFPPPSLPPSLPLSLFILIFYSPSWSSVVFGRSKVADNEIQLGKTTLPIIGTFIQLFSHSLDFFFSLSFPLYCVPSPSGLHPFGRCIWHCIVCGPTDPSVRLSSFILFALHAQSVRLYEVRPEMDA